MEIPVLEEYKKENVISLMNGYDGLTDWSILPLEEVTKRQEKKKKKWGDNNFDAVTTKYINRLVQKDDKTLKLLPNIIDNNRLSLADNFKSIKGSHILNFPEWTGEITTNELYIRSTIHNTQTVRKWSNSCFKIVKIEYTFVFEDEVDNYYTTNRYTSIDSAGKFVNFFQSSEDINPDTQFSADFGAEKVSGTMNVVTKKFSSLRLEKDIKTIAVSHVSFERRCINDQSGSLKLTKFNSKIEKGIWDHITELNFKSVSASVYIEFTVEDIIDALPNEFVSFFGISKIQIGNLTNFFTFLNYVKFNNDVDLKNGAEAWGKADQYVRSKINSALALINSYWNSCKSFTKQICRISLGGSKLSNSNPRYDTALDIIGGFIKASMKFKKKWVKLSSYGPQQKWDNAKIKLDFVEEMFEFKDDMATIAAYVTDPTKLTAMPGSWGAYIEVTSQLLPEFAKLKITSNIIPELLDHAKVQYVAYNNFFIGLKKWYSTSSDVRNQQIADIKQIRIDKMAAMKLKLAELLLQIGKKEYLTQKNVIAELEDVALGAILADDAKIDIARGSIIEVLKRYNYIVPDGASLQELLDIFNDALKKNADDAMSADTRAATNVSSNMPSGGAPIGYGNPAEDVVMDTFELPVVAEDYFATEDLNTLSIIFEKASNDDTELIDLGNDLTKKMMSALALKYNEKAIKTIFESGIDWDKFQQVVYELLEIRNRKNSQDKNIDFYEYFEPQLNKLVEMEKKIKNKKVAKPKFATASTTAAVPRVRPNTKKNQP